MPISHESIEENEAAFALDAPKDQLRFQVAPSPSSFWGLVISYVCFAAALHAAIVVILAGAYQFFEAVRFGSSLTDFLITAVQIVVFCFIGLILIASIVSLTAACVGCIVCPIFQAMLWSLEINSSQVYLGGFVGGMIAYACSYTFYGSIVTPIGSVADGTLIIVTLAILLTLIATVMGQAAGIVGARKVLQEYDYSHSYELPRPKFQIKQLLWITFWVAICLTVLKTISLFSPLFWLITSIWLGIQYFVLRRVLRFMKYRESKQIAD